MMKKMSAVGIAAVMIASQTMAGDAMQWRVEDGGNGHWYAVVVSSTNNDWDVAKLAAESTGGYLMCLETTDEKSFAFASFTPTAYPSAWVNQENGTNINPNFGPWIGGTQEAASVEPLGGWRWISGPTFDPTEVSCCNNDCGGTNEDCLHISMNSGISWNDLPNHTNCGYAPTSYVIEWSADCNNDGIVDYGQCRNGTLADYNRNNVPDCCDRGEACVVGNYPVQWRVEGGGNGHWYQCLRTAGSGEVWNVSHAAANALGGHLATLTSQQENSWVYELSVAQTAWSGRGGPLLGGYKLPDNSFRWVTDEPWSYTSWLPGEPSSGLWEPYLNFLGPQGTSSSGATWNDTDAIIPPDNSGDQTYTYIVEWEADCNNDGIVDYGQIRIGQLADTNNNGVPDTCECIGDIDTDGTINGSDLGIMLAYWGTTSIDPASIACDLNVDGGVNGSDLGILLASWGPCNL